MGILLAVRVQLLASIAIKARFRDFNHKIHIARTGMTLFIVFACPLDDCNVRFWLVEIRYANGAFPPNEPTRSEGAAEGRFPSRRLTRHEAGFFPIFSPGSHRSARSLDRREPPSETSRSYSLTLKRYNSAAENGTAPGSDRRTVCVCRDCCGAHLHLARKLEQASGVEKSGRVRASWPGRWPTGKVGQVLPGQRQTHPRDLHGNPSSDHLTRGG